MTQKKLGHWYLLWSHFLATPIPRGSGFGRVSGVACEGAIIIYSAHDNILSNFMVPNVCTQGDNFLPYILHIDNPRMDNGLLEGDFGWQVFNGVELGSVLLHLCPHLQQILVILEIFHLVMVFEGFFWRRVRLSSNTLRLQTISAGEAGQKLAARRASHGATPYHHPLHHPSATPI